MMKKNLLIIVICLLSIDCWSQILTIDTIKMYRKPLNSYTISSLLEHKIKKISKNYFLKNVPDECLNLDKRSCELSFIDILSKSIGKKAFTGIQYTLYASFTMSNQIGDLPELYIEVREWHCKDAQTANFLYQKLLLLNSKTIYYPLEYNWFWFIDNNKVYFIDTHNSKMYENSNIIIEDIKIAFK